jgi:hypothetical protein
MGMIITDTSAAHNGDADAAASQCVKKYLSFNPGQILRVGHNILFRHSASYHGQYFAHTAEPMLHLKSDLDAECKRGGSARMPKKKPQHQWSPVSTQETSSNKSKIKR